MVRMKALQYWGPAIGFAVFLFAMSSIPGSIIKGIHVPVDEKFIPFSMQENPDKYVHAFLYATFGWLWLRIFVFVKKMPLLKAALFTFAITAFYGATDEWHQYFVPDRYCDLNDWIADCVGCLISVIPLSFLYRRSFRTSNNSTEVATDPP